MTYNDMSLEQSLPEVAELLFGRKLEEKRRAEALSRSEREQLLAGLREMFDSDNGRALLFWLLSITHIYSCSFTGNSYTYFAEGERNVGLQLYALMVEARPYAAQEIVNIANERIARGISNG